MQIQYTRTFKKQYKKLPEHFQLQFDERVKLFLKDPADSRLRVHPLQGKFAGYWSLNVNGDLRALFFKQGNQLILFVLIGTHSQLYG